MLYVERLSGPTVECYVFNSKLLVITWLAHSLFLFVFFITAPQKKRKTTFKFELYKS
jgi:hypothetical protein